MWASSNRVVFGEFWELVYFASCVHVEQQTFRKVPPMHSISAISSVGMPMQIPPRPIIVFLSAEQAMGSLTIGRSKFYELIRDGLLPRGVNVLGRSVRWVEYEIETVKHSLATAADRSAIESVVAWLQATRCAPVAPSRQVWLQGSALRHVDEEIKPLTFLTERQVRKELCVGRTKLYEAIEQGLIPQGLHLIGRSKRWVSYEIEWMKRLLAIETSTSGLEMSTRWLTLFR